MLFVAQLDFRGTEHRKLIPGDLLTCHYCIACGPNRPNPEGDAEAEAFRRRHGLSLPELGPGFRYAAEGACFTWQDVASTPSQLPPAEIPLPANAPLIGPFYGIPHGVRDYLTPPEAYGGGLGGEKYTHLHFTLQGTKVGGYPPPIQDEDAPMDSRGRPMRFLGTLGSVTSYAIDGKTTSGDWMWGDMGCLYLWISTAKAKPELSWFCQGY